MKRDLPPLPWLRAFEAAARHLSFTHAAQELNLTQAAVSKQIKLLEEHLREPLFIRRIRRIELTKSGAAYVPKLRDAFERVEAGTKEVFGQRRTSTLTVRANNSFAVNWLAPRLGLFLDEHPDVPVRIINSIWIDSSDQTHVDVDIQYGTGTWEGRHASRLTVDRLMPLCDLATARTLAKPEDLKAHRLIHVLGYEEGWAHWLAQAGLPDMSPRHALQVDSSLIAFELAQRGYGVALGRTCLLGGNVTSGRLVAPFDLDVTAKEAFYLLTRAGKPLQPNTVVFINWIRSTLSQAGQTLPSG